MSDDLIERLRAASRPVKVLAGIEEKGAVYRTDTPVHAALFKQAADALSEMVLGLSALVHCQSALSRREIREAAAGLLAKVGAKPADYRDQSPFVARALAAEAALSEMRAELEREQRLSKHHSDLREQYLAEAQAAEAQLERARDALEAADDTLKNITLHDPKTPGLHFESLEQLLESAVGIAALRREAIAPILAALSQDEPDTDLGARG